MIDILYVAYNRLEFTRESFDALLRYTPWEQVDRIYIADDLSTDGTREWLEAASVDIPAERVMSRDKFGGPVSAMNWYLDDRYPQYDPNDVNSIQSFVKIDNDFVVCPGYLEVLLNACFFNAGIDLFGIEPMYGPAIPHTAHPGRRAVEDVAHIGGKGLIRLRAFDSCRPRSFGFNGYQGFTQWQTAHPEIRKTWLKPEIPVFGLDQLPFEPYQSLAARYEELGWARRWPAYPTDSNMQTYWNWWTPQFTPVTV